jgi:dynein heavy chain
MTENRQLVEKLEIELLSLLSSKANLLEDSSLLEVLNHTKLTSESIANKISQSADTQRNISEACEKYRSVAVHGSNFYFLVSEMRMIESMYDTPLSSYLKKFDEAMRMAATSDSTLVRVEAIIATMTRLIHKFVTRGMFNKHRNLFVLQLALRVDVMSSELSREGMNLLLRGGSEMSNSLAKPLAWLPADAYKNLVAFSIAIPKFSSVVQDIKQAEFEWAAWYALSDPETQDLPRLGFHDYVWSVHKFLLIRCLRIDRMMAAAAL